MKIVRKTYIILLYIFILYEDYFCFKNINQISINFNIKKIYKIYKNKNQYINKRNILLSNYGKEYFERKKKLNILSNILNIDVYPSFYDNRNVKLVDIKKKFNYLKNGEKIQDHFYIVYGRVIKKRNGGIFLVIKDDEDQLQIYLNKNIKITNENNENIYEDKSLIKNKINMEMKNYEENEQNKDQIEQQIEQNKQQIKHIEENEKKLIAHKFIEIGDFIYVKGFIKKTITGEITLEAKKIKILSKTLLPLPDKYKGMKDLEYIYRKRYINFLINNEEKKKIKKTFEIIQEMRKYLIKKKYLEVNTPILQILPGGANAKPFKTFLNSSNLNLYLRISPELYLKKLIISGISEKIFEISKCFRNEGISSIHYPEFTLLEIYKCFSNYIYMINFVEKFIKYIGKKLNINCNYNIFKKKWKKISFINIIKKYTSIDFLKLSFDDAYKEAQKINITFEEEKTNLNWGLIVEEVFNKKVRPFLTNDPIHIFHLPSEISPLAKSLNKNKKLAERFETYIGQIEIANGYTEEANPIEQEEKFLKQHFIKSENKQNIYTEKQNIKLNTNNLLNNKLNYKKIENNQIDYDYITALCHGLPPTSGLGIGIERLCMIFTNSKSIKSILPFTLIKPY